MSTKTLLTIFNVANEDATCQLFLSYWQRTGADIMFSSPLDAQSRLENVTHYHTGQALTEHARHYWYYQSRVLDTFRYCITLPYEVFIFTQYDSIALGPLPSMDANSNIHYIAGYSVAGFKSRTFLHPPWCFGRNRLEQFVKASASHPIQTTEQGIMDRWIAYVMQEANMPVEHPNWAWSSNAIDTPQLVESARAAIANGALFIHGCKHKRQLAAILE